MMSNWMTILFIIITLLMQGCFRGEVSEDPPIHINPNMDNQNKVRDNTESNFFADGAGNRSSIPGTIAKGRLFEDTEFYFGKTAEGKFITKSPIPYKGKVVERGEERFNIFCAPCHGQKGEGNGIVVKKGYMPPPTFHSDLIRNFEDGRIYDVIANGVRNMPSYGPQIPVKDRWAIVGFVRALQRSGVENIPQKTED